MKKTLYKIMITALSIVLIIAAMPLTVLAEGVPLGEESPFISAQFLDSNGDEADGNALAAGERYTVNLALKNISNVAIFNLTAQLTDDITITNVTSIADVENSGFEYGGYKVDTDNNKFVIVISTVNNTTYTELNGETVMVTLTVDVNTDGDFADFFQVSTSRNHTFIIANLEEGNEAAYVYKDLEQTATDYPFLNFDMSPSSNITVTGTVKVSEDEFGSKSTSANVTDATVNAIDSNGDIVATVQTGSDGRFSIEVPEDAVSLEISKYCVPKRTVALSGNVVTDYPVIPVIAVDYDSNGAFGAGDKGLFSDKFNGTDLDADLDGNGAFGAGDKGIFKYFFTGGKAVSYNDYTL